MKFPNPQRIFLLYLPDCPWGPRWNYSGSPLLALSRGGYLNLQGRYYQIPRCIFFVVDCLNTFQITRCYQPLLSTLQLCPTTFEQSLSLSEDEQQHPRETSALQLPVIMLLCEPEERTEEITEAKKATPFPAPQNCDACPFSLSFFSQTSVQVSVHKQIVFKWLFQGFMRKLISSLVKFQFYFMFWFS